MFLARNTLFMEEIWITCLFDIKFIGSKWNFLKISWQGGVLWSLWHYVVTEKVNLCNTIKNESNTKIVYADFSCVYAWHRNHTTHVDHNAFSFLFMHSHLVYFILIITNKSNSIQSFAQNTNHSISINRDNSRDVDQSIQHTFHTFSVNLMENSCDFIFPLWIFVLFCSASVDEKIYMLYTAKKREWKEKPNWFIHVTYKRCKILNKTENKNEFEHEHWTFTFIPS